MTLARAGKSKEWDSFFFFSRQTSGNMDSPPNLNKPAMNGDLDEICQLFRTFIMSHDKADNVSSKTAVVAVDSELRAYSDLANAQGNVAVQRVDLQVTRTK